jgi:hypothetical protein
VARLVPGAALTLQLDEPGLPGVLAGTLPTASGFGRLRAVAGPVVSDGLRAVLEAATTAGAVGTVVHCCGPDPPVELLVRAGVGALSLDIGLLRSADWEQVAGAVEGGTALWAGALPTTPAVLAGAVPTVQSVVDAVWTPWRALGLDAASAADLVLTPACGLAGATPAAARRILAITRDAARALAERAAA